MTLETRAKQFVTNMLGNMKPNLSNSTSPTRFQDAMSKILEHMHSHLHLETIVPLSLKAYDICLIHLFVRLHGNKMPTSFS